MLGGLAGAFWRNGGCCTNVRSGLPIYVLADRAGLQFAAFDSLQEWKLVGGLEGLRNSHHWSDPIQSGGELDT